MAESVGVSFVDESDFQKEGKRYILRKNSQFEVCSTVSSDRNGSMARQAYQILAKILCRKRAAINISSHNGSKSYTDSDYNPELWTSAISSSFNISKRAEL